MVSHYVASLLQSLVVLQTILDVEHHVVRLVEVVEVVRQCEVGRALRLHLREVGDGAVLTLDAVSHDSPR